VLISHDLAVVARLADRAAVMRDGRIVEQGPIRDLLCAPRHPYTIELLEAATGDHRPAPAPRPGRPVLELRGLRKEVTLPDGARRAVVKDVTLTVAPGETVGLVGESGCGKTTTALLAVALQEPDAGTVLLNGIPFSGISERRRRPRRRHIGFVWQDSLSSFDPVHPVGRALRDALRVAGEDARDVFRLLDQVGLDAGLARRRPAELSGGQIQRAAIARALASRPAVLVCDEPLSALDVTVQRHILDLLRRLQTELGLGMLFISHDLRVVRRLSHRVAVMRDGEIVEEGDPEQVLTSPRHPYTRELVAAQPWRLPPVLDRS
jgi:peptide/nickel transport system ATP-binding protein